LASVVLAARIGLRWGRPEAVLAAWLVAGCSWLVLAGAEARGYALVVCFALLALECLWSYLDSGSRRALALFWLAAVLGFLSHLTFVHAYLGFVVWSLRRFARQRRSRGDEVRRLLTVHGVPGAFFVVFYLLSVRDMEVGGGPPVGIAEVLSRLIGLGLGGPAGGWVSLPFVVAAGLVLPCGLWLLWRKGMDVWVFFAVAIVASPALFLVRRPPFLFERYFLIPLVFFLLLSALILGQLVRRSGLARAAGLVLLGVFLAGNAWTVGAFIQAGRGQFHAALAWLIEHDERDPVWVTGDDDFRVRKYILFYAPSLAPGRRVIYRSQAELRPGGADWLLIHRLDDRHPPAQRERDARGNLYELQKAYPSRGLGAWGWFVYRRLGKDQVRDEERRRHPDEAQVFHVREHQDEGKGIDGEVHGNTRQAKP
jgi:hypothetical protein